MTGFVVDDIIITNASVGNFVAVDADTYTADITATGNGDVTLDIAANVAKDSAGNGNIAANQVVVANSIVEDTQKIASGYLISRANHLLANQPDLIGLLDGTSLANGGDLGNLALNVNDGNLHLAFSSSLSRIMSKADQRIAQAFAPRNSMRTNPQMRSQAYVPGVQMPSDIISQSGDDVGLAYVDENSIVDGGIQAIDQGLIDGSTQEINTPLPQRNFDIWTRLYGANTRSSNDEGRL